MHGGGGLLILALVLIGIPGFFAVRAVARHRGAQARPKAGGGIVSGWFQHRRDKAMENARHYNGMLREAARHKHRLTEQEHAAKVRASARGNSPAGGDSEFSGPDGDARPPRQTVIGRVIRLGKPPAPPGTPTEAQPTGPYRRRADAEAAAGRAAAAGNGPADCAGRPAGGDSPPARPRSPEPTPQGAEQPAPQATRPAPGRPGAAVPAQEPPVRRTPAHSESPTLEGVVMTTLPDISAPSAVAAAVPGAEEAVEGMRRVHAHARSGNIRAKRRALLALVVICRHGARMASAMARALSEPDQHYGPEVTEPIAMGSMYLSAAASSFADGDNALKALLHASVDESMRSGRQLPHHGELTETGAY